MFTIPNEHNVHQLIVSIARQQMLDLPMPFIDQMKSGMPQVFIETFLSQLTVPAIDFLFNQRLPTPEKVCKVLEADEEHLSQAKLDCIYYLQQFVLQLDQEDLVAFLHFVTGSSVMPEKNLDQVQLICR
jgi:hypothetical protein